MFVLGIQGSPRKKGNSNYLLSLFLDQAKGLGAQTHTISAPKKNIKPCWGCGHCERKGFCIIQDDDMSSEVYPLIRQADVVVAATPIYFYNTSAQLKLLIDRCQSFWSRRYRLKLSDPKRKNRQGFLLSVGATRGKNLFEGVELTGKYFFDAIGASFDGSLGYREMEGPGELEKHPTVLDDVKKEVTKLIGPNTQRKKILFACRENACRSQIASAFAQHKAGGKVEAISGGSEPSDQINPVMEEVMAQKGIDMAFRTPRSIEDAVSEVKPDIIVTMGCGEKCPFIPDVEIIDWDLPDPSGKPIEFMIDVLDEIEKRVDSLVGK
jgi:multimeric flavodoxin WrbA/protein-tyrosine-phosphatase